jgi:hypothetical protein
VFLSTGSRPIIAAIPIISPVLAIIEPTAFPKAKAGFPFIAANTDTVASGKVVPNDTIVAPIISFGIPQRIERQTAWSTRISAPLLKVNSVNKNIIMIPIVGRCSKKFNINASIFSPFVLIANFEFKKTLQLSLGKLQSLT